MQLSESYNMLFYNMFLFNAALIHHGCGGEFAIQAIASFASIGGACSCFHVVVCLRHYVLF
jgi:hypothetical protein